MPSRFLAQVLALAVFENGEQRSPLQARTRYVYVVDRRRPLSTKLWTFAFVRPAVTNAPPLARWTSKRVSFTELSRHSSRIRDLESATARSSVGAAGWFSASVVAVATFDQGLSPPLFTARTRKKYVVDGCR